MVFPHIRLLWFKFSILSWIFLSTLFYYLPLLKRYEFLLIVQFSLLLNLMRCLIQKKKRIL